MNPRNRRNTAWSKVNDPTSGGPESNRTGWQTAGPKQDGSVPPCRPRSRCGVVRRSPDGWAIEFSSQSVLVLALLQVGALVAGVLGAGLNRRLLEVATGAVPGSIRWLVDYGVVLLVIPLAWLSLVQVVRLNPRTPDPVKRLVFMGGIGLLAGIVIVFGLMLLRPWFVVHMLAVSTH
jgi:hypothetical protein